MSGRLFRLSTTINGEYGADGDAATAGDNNEYTIGKTSNGTHMVVIVQYDFAANSALAGLLYFYDGNTTANAGAIMVDWMFMAISVTIHIPSFMHMMLRVLGLIHPIHSLQWNNIYCNYSRAKSIWICS